MTMTREDRTSSVAGGARPGVFREPDAVTIRDEGDRPELQPGDLLVSIAGHDIARFEDIATALECERTRECVIVQVECEGKVPGYWWIPYAFVTHGAA
jgi:hypothetical protein